jgi:hydrogenase nickel incorporation protein HypA/HybF
MKNSSSGRKLANIIPGALEFAFDALSKNTALNGAKLVLETVPIEACCRYCGKVYEAESVPLSCPRCSSHDAEIKGGTDVYLMSIDFDEGEEIENED